VAGILRQTQQGDQQRLSRSTLSLTAICDELQRRQAWNGMMPHDQ